jgi:hypothetical protein
MGWKTWSIIKICQAISFWWEGVQR